MKTRKIVLACILLSLIAGCGSTTKPTNLDNTTASTIETVDFDDIKPEVNESVTTERAVAEPVATETTEEKNENEISTENENTDPRYAHVSEYAAKLDKILQDYAAKCGEANWNGNFKAENNTVYTSKDYIKKFLDDDWIWCEDGIMEIDYRQVKLGVTGAPGVVVKLISGVADEYYLVFKMNTTLELTFVGDGYYRSYCDINESGYVWQGGSAGAGDYVEYEGYLDENGKYNRIFYTETYMGPMYMQTIDRDSSIAVYGVDSEEENLDVYVIEYKIDDVQYLVCDVNDEAQNYDEQLAKAKEFVRLSTASGHNFVSREKAEQLINDKKASLGITDAIISDAKF